MDYYNYGIGNTNGAYGGQFPQYTNPYFQPQQQNTCQCDNRFMWIQGKEAAKSYPMAPDKTIFFLDDRDSYAYLKKTDRDGKTVQFKTFKLVEEPEEVKPVSVPDSNYISKEEFYAQNESLVQMINELKGMIRQNNKPYNSQKGQVNRNG